MTTQQKAEDVLSTIRAIHRELLPESALSRADLDCYLVALAIDADVAIAADELHARGVS